MRSRQQALKDYCPNIYTVVAWLQHRQGSSRASARPKCTMGFKTFMKWHSNFKNIQKRLFFIRLMLSFCHLNRNLTQNCLQSFSKHLSENSTAYCSAKNNCRTKTFLSKQILRVSLLELNLYTLTFDQNIVRNILRNISFKRIQSK